MKIKIKIKYKGVIKIKPQCGPGIINNQIITEFFEHTGANLFTEMLIDQIIAANAECELVYNLACIRVARWMRLIKQTWR